ncbi:MAG: TfoX/Sxy family protein [Rhodanobacteraceae bacterium]|nr:TfoX/Sxy family protein [Rhodanobacteraceae bacterium]
MLDHFRELLAPRGHIRTRSMFGGTGIWCDDAFIAIVIDDQIYLKVDGLTQPEFERWGLQPLVYTAQGRTVTLGFWSVPAEALESPRAMKPWAQMALAAATRKSTGQRGKQRA